MLLLANNTFSFFFLQIGFVEVHADDGYLEIFGLKQGWHASIIMVDLISAHCPGTPLTLNTRNFFF